MWPRPGSEARDELDHGQRSLPDSTNIEANNSRTRTPRRWLTFRPVRGGHKGELWASAKLEEDGRWMGWSGGRRGKRTGSPNPEGAALSVADRWSSFLF